ncbi:MAG: bifunctional phosphoribosyl-AMP cyclohydrolase/phosphoribosyl-ATP diphosphatase HisIE [Syntrophomonadaceae bacterium]|nr:bifunctional phosphoribosyl-AMP cyclohydrolase/phosphoribosyl-ATP diphosphatase HisIE [Syntrophomonadaceae bacterium]
MVFQELTESFQFNSDGLMPAIIQDAGTGQVLMLAYMNKESLHKSLATGETWFFSRSRQELWHKGATSGHVQKIKQIFFDCDQDALLIHVEQSGVACHEGEFSCFHHLISIDGEQASIKDRQVTEHNLAIQLNLLRQVIEKRKIERPEGSYTSYLFNAGQDKILKKLAEEAAEVVIASKNLSREEVTYEMADLWYHCLVLMAYHGISLQDLAQELKGRAT